MASGSPREVVVGQKWSTWSPARMHWLLATVVKRSAGRATLKFDVGYDMAAPDNVREVDERSMLCDSNLFRLVLSGDLAETSVKAVLPIPQQSTDGANAVASLKSFMDEAPTSEKDQMTQLGITRVPVDEFHSGGYRYSNLRDAISQAKRAAASPKLPPL